MPKLSGACQLSKKGHVGTDEEAAVEAELEAEMEQEEEAEMEQREEAEWRLEEEQGTQDPSALGEGQEPYEEGASEAQAELRREEDIAERRPVFEGWVAFEHFLQMNPDLQALGDVMAILPAAWFLGRGMLLATCNLILL